MIDFDDWYCRRQ